MWGVDLWQIDPILLELLLIYFYLTVHTRIEHFLSRLQLALDYISKYW